MHERYPLDLVLLSERIGVRRLSEYIMQSNITTLTMRSGEDVERFIDTLHNLRAEISGEELANQHLDEAGLQALKERLASESKAIAVK